jgi:hypothetical protein
MTSKNRIKRIVLSVVLSIVCYHAPAWADEIIDSINEALEYYKEGDLGEAISGLDYATQLIRQKRGSQLQELLPQPLAGWTAKDTTSQSGSLLGMGMISAKREYRKDTGSITIDIATEPPMLAGMMMMFSNPSIAGADGGKLTKIKRQKAIVKYRPANKQGEITIIVAKRHLISVKGRQVSEQDLMDYASAINYKDLKKF